jgi:hypothetical protein
MTAVADEAQRWRLRRRFDSAAAVQVYSKATALEALVRLFGGMCGPLACSMDHCVS